MHSLKKTTIVRIIAFFLVIVFVCPVNVHALESRASLYLDSYNAYPYAAGAGKVQIYFTVTGTEYMDELGALTIMVYESTDNVSFSHVATYTNGTHPRMLGYNDFYYSGHVDYQGRTGRYYKAYVCIWAGKDGGGDTRYFWTGSVQA